MLVVGVITDHCLNKWGIRIGCASAGDPETSSARLNGRAGMTGKGKIPLSVELAKRLYGFYHKDESLTHPR